MTKGGVMNGKTTFERAFELPDLGFSLPEIRACIRRKGYEEEQLFGTTITIQLGQRIPRRKGKGIEASRR